MLKRQWGLAVAIVLAGGAITQAQIQQPSGVAAKPAKGLVPFYAAEILSSHYEPDGAVLESPARLRATTTALPPVRMASRADHDIPTQHLFDDDPPIADPPAIIEKPSSQNIVPPPPQFRNSSIVPISEDEAKATEAAQAVASQRRVAEVANKANQSAKNTSSRKWEVDAKVQTDKDGNVQRDTFIHGSGVKPPGVDAMAPGCS